MDGRSPYYSDPAVIKENRARMSAGVALNCRRKARRILCSSPKPQRAAMTPSGVLLCSMASRAAWVRAISTALAGVRLVRVTKVRANVRRLY